MAKDSAKILFRLERDQDGYPPVNVESLWAIPRKDGYELDSIPFFARGVALGDIVCVNISEDGGLEFDQVVRHGGHSTYRVWLRTPQTNDPQFTIDQIKAQGMDAELDSSGLIAVDIPPSLSLDKAEAFLFSGEDSGRWGLQEGYRAGD